MVAKALTTSWR